MKLMEDNMRIIRYEHGDGVVVFHKYDDYHDHVDEKVPCSKSTAEKVKDTIGEKWGEV